MCISEEQGAPHISERMLMTGAQISIHFHELSGVICAENSRQVYENINWNLEGERGNWNMKWKHERLALRRNRSYSCSGGLMMWTSCCNYGKALRTKIKDICTEVIKQMTEQNVFMFKEGKLMENWFGKRVKRCHIPFRAECSLEFLLPWRCSSWTRVKKV